MKKYLHFIVPLVAVILCSFFLLTTLDHKVYDLFLRAVPSLEEDPSVLVVKIDDVSIERVGLFPWTRDIMADAIVFLREMGAATVVFDLSYLDRSPVKVDPAYVQNELPGYLDYGFEQINSAVAQILDSIAGQNPTRDELEAYRDMLIEFNSGIKGSLDTSIAYVTRDVDEYFAKTLKFFGDSYLTLTMINANDIIGDEKTFDMARHDTEWLESRIALTDLSVQHDTKTPEAIGIHPAISLLLRSAKNAGFVNADPDADGYRRRVHLLHKFNGNYYGQLVFVPLLDYLGNPEVTVTNSAITLTNAQVHGTETTIRIPRTTDGSILIHWPKKKFVDYNTLPAWDLIGYNRHEAAFVKNLGNMNDAGFFSYWTDDETPLEKYSNAQYIRELLYEGEQPDDGITFATYRDYREDFFSSAAKLIDPAYEQAILADLDPDDTELTEYVSGFFAEVRQQYRELLEMRSKVSAKTAGSFSIIGVDATSMTDVGLTTFQENFPNVGVHATISNMILSGQFLDDSPAVFSILIALILSLALAFFIKRLDTKESMFVGIVTLIISVFALLVFFIMTKRYVGTVVPFTSVALTFISLSAINFLTTIREKSFLRSAFSRYLSPEVINEIINDPSKLNLGGEKREMTAIFTDIKGFSGISEQMDPADLVNLLNRYLTTMSNIVLENKGTIDKYEGDAIIAFFGAPIHMDNHATLACKTAVRMKQAEQELNGIIEKEHLSPAPLFTRIGINTGDMIVGNMGTANKMDYTIMGNAVNLAARLEGVNKQYNTRGILISEHTRNQLDDSFLVRRLDRVRVVGVSTPLRLYELLALSSEASETMSAYCAEWETAIDRYEDKQFSEARRLFFSLASRDPEDLIAPLYIQRCDEFITNPPESGWDGVFNLTQK